MDKISCMKAKHLKLFSVSVKKNYKKNLTKIYKYLKPSDNFQETINKIYLISKNFTYKFN